MPPYDAAIFDLDGTLIDTERLFIDAAVTAARRLSLPFDRAFMASLAGQSDAEGFRIMQAHVGPATDLEPFQTEWSALVRTYAKGIPLMRGVTDLLSDLAARRFPRAIATNSYTDGARRKLAHAGIAHHFDPDHVIGVDLVARAKPAPDLFLAAADLLGVAPARCLAFEDSDAGTAAALAAGMTVVQIPDSHPAGTRDAHHLADSILEGARAAGLI
jgi:HAD superfamily hydrolase (TIGR01509 family)